MKRLIVCSDGTWNSSDHANTTNVVRVVQAVNPRAPDGTPQVVFYDQGVGTRNWVDKWIGGITGSGLSKNVQDAYRFLLHNYEEGDEIYLFGFSRGSYTVRSTVGFIRNCGLLTKAHIDKVDDAYKLYKRQDAHPNSDEARRFREAFSTEVEIRFIGVWDTVGALGIPAAGLRRLTQRKYTFHDVKLSRIVRHGYQAIAIDEQRKPYAPSPWKTTPDDPQIIEQVWFSGVHSDVGGGYQDRGLGDITFLWMVDKAKSCGLVFDDDFIASVTNPDPIGTLHKTMNIGWWIVGPGPLVRQVGTTDVATEAVHAAAVERFNSDLSYRPSNLASYMGQPEHQVTERDAETPQ